MAVDPWTVHDAACARGASTYVDPTSGYQVFTAVGLRKRGRCCGCACRHCPFAHEEVPDAVLAGKAKVPAFLHGSAPSDGVDVLFWSGGKDSYLALRKLLAAAQAPVVLLTTFDVGSRQVAHQEVAVGQVVRQAMALALPLLGIPLHPGRDYIEQIREGLALLPTVRRLVFGDLHLEHIREWREQNLGPLAVAIGAQLAYPLWKADYDSLLDELEASGVPCVVSAAPHDAVQVGQRFDRELVAGLPPDVDAFGEGGEFHTIAQVWAAGR